MFLLVICLTGAVLVTSVTIAGFVSYAQAD